MKIWNRFISFALATTLLLTVPLVSFAAGTKNSTSSDFTTVQSASGELLVRAYDLDMVTRFLNSTMMENW